MKEALIDLNEKIGLGFLLESDHIEIITIAYLTGFFPERMRHDLWAKDDHGEIVPWKIVPLSLNKVSRQVHGGVQVKLT